MPIDRLLEACGFTQTPSAGSEQPRAVVLVTTTAPHVGTFNPPAFDFTDDYPVMTVTADIEQDELLGALAAAGIEVKLINGREVMMLHGIAESLDGLRQMMVEPLRAAEFEERLAQFGRDVREAAEQYKPRDYLRHDPTKNNRRRRKGKR